MSVMQQILNDGMVCRVEILVYDLGTGALTVERTETSWSDDPLVPVQVTKANKQLVSLAFAIVVFRGTASSGARPDVFIIRLLAN